MLGAKYLGLSPELARPPGFLIATIVNFGLNRSITFRHSRAPLFRAFLRYCGVAAIGLAVNYAVYSACVFLAPRAGIAVTPAILPLFVAAGSGVGDGFDLRRLSVLRLSILRVADCLAQSLRKRAMIASEALGAPLDVRFAL